MDKKEDEQKNLFNEKKKELKEEIQEETAALDAIKVEQLITSEDLRLAKLTDEQIERFFVVKDKIAETAKAHAISRTYEEDWVIHTSRDKKTGQETKIGFLQDKGCSRIVDLFGVEITNITDPPERINHDDGTFTIVFKADGFSKLFNVKFEKVIGSRWSGGFFADNPDEMNIVKSAQANLYGRIIRRISGLSGMPVDILGKFLDTSKIIGVEWKTGEVASATKKQIDAIKKLIIEKVQDMTKTTAENLVPKKLNIKDASTLMQSLWKVASNKKLSINEYDEMLHELKITKPVENQNENGGQSS